MTETIVHWWANFEVHLIHVSYVKFDSLNCQMIEWATYEWIAFRNSSLCRQIDFYYSYQ